MKMAYIHVYIVCQILWNIFFSTVLMDDYWCGDRCCANYQLKNGKCIEPITTEECNETFWKFLASVFAFSTCAVGIGLVWYCAYKRYQCIRRREQNGQDEDSGGSRPIENAQHVYEAPIPQAQRREPAAYLEIERLDIKP